MLQTRVLYKWSERKLVRFFKDTHYSMGDLNIYSHAMMNSTQMVPRVISRYYGKLNIPIVRFLQGPLSLSVVISTVLHWDCRVEAFKRLRLTCQYVFNPTFFQRWYRVLCASKSRILLFLFTSPVLFYLKTYRGMQNGSTVIKASDKGSN